MNEENNIQEEKSRWPHFTKASRGKWFWVLIVLLVIILGAGSYLYYRYFIWIKMSPSLRQKAETALAAGITVNDPQNDFLSKELMGKEMETDPYVIPYIDIKSLTAGKDDKYFYYKVTFWGKIPKKPDSINGDYIIGPGPQLSLTDEKGITQATLAAEFGWLPKFHIFSYNSWYATDPTGIVWPENERMKYQKFDSKVYGGAGTDYIMGAFPLDKLHFDIGKTAYFILPVETKSEQHTHAAVDHLGGIGKSEALISWKVGTKEFTLDEDFFENNGGGGEDPQKEDPKSGKNKQTETVVDFETCAKIYPVMKTYPEQCKAPDGRSFTKKY